MDITRSFQKVVARLRTNQDTRPGLFRHLNLLAIPYSPFVWTPPRLLQPNGIVKYSAASRLYSTGIGCTTIKITYRQHFSFSRIYIYHRSQVLATHNFSRLSQLSSSIYSWTSYTRYIFASYPFLFSRIFPINTALHRRDCAFALNRHRHRLARMASLFVTSPSPRHNNVSRRRLPGSLSTLATGSLSRSLSGPAVYPLLILFDASSCGFPRGALCSCTSMSASPLLGLMKPCRCCNRSAFA